MTKIKFVDTVASLEDVLSTKKLVPVPSIQTISVTLHGRKGSPLVVHSFSEKAKRQIRDKQQKKATKAKQERTPDAEFEAAKYFDSHMAECVPITALKKAIVSAATAFDDLTKVALRQAVFVDCTANPGSPFIPIENFEGKQIHGRCQEDAVTIGMGKRGLTYRPRYDEWQLRINIEFNPRLVSEEQLRALLAQAGWGVGICEGRPEKSSALGWGRFEVVG